MNEKQAEVNALTISWLSIHENSDLGILAYNNMQ